MHVKKATKWLICRNLRVLFLFISFLSLSSLCYTSFRVSTKFSSFTTSFQKPRPQLIRTSLQQEVNHVVHDRLKLPSPIPSPIPIPSRSSKSIPQGKYALIRAIGNALPPRHDPSRTLKNLRFILENEVLEDEELVKHWVLNRIIDQQVLFQIKSLLEEFNASYSEISFDLSEYATTQLLVTSQESKKFPIDQVHPNPMEIPNEWVENVVYNDIYDTKNRFALSINHARNEMLLIGKNQIKARWILPWDQNVFLLRNAWKQIKQDLLTQSHQYFVSWMDRLTQENDIVLTDAYTPTPWEEPQLIFRNDTKEQFDTKWRYGRRDKVSLLIRLGVQGIWQTWGWSTWETQRTWFNLSIETIGNPVGNTSASVVRLYSGNQLMEQDTNDAAYYRELQRAKGVLQVLKDLDDQAMCQLHGFQQTKPLIYDWNKLQAYKKTVPKDIEVQRLIEYARKSLLSTGWSVVDVGPLNIWREKTFLTNIVPEEKEEEVDILDDAVLFQQVVYNVTSLLLAFELTEDVIFLNKAYTLLNTWFISESTRVVPNLDFTDLLSNGHKIWDEEFQMYRYLSEGSGSGIRITTSLHFLWDLIRQMDSKQVKSSKEQVLIYGMKQWARQFYDYLRQAPHALRLFAPSSSSSSNELYGLEYDLQLACLAAFLNEPGQFRYYLDSTRGRLLTLVYHHHSLQEDNKSFNNNTRRLRLLAIWNSVLSIQAHAGLNLFEFDVLIEGKNIEEVYTSSSSMLCRWLRQSMRPCCLSNEIDNKCTNDINEQWLTQTLRDKMSSHCPPEASDEKWFNCPQSTTPDPNIFFQWSIGPFPFLYYF